MPESGDNDHAEARYALLSVHDKSGIVDLGRKISAAGYKIISTGGTARVLAKAKIEVIEVSEHTSFPEILDGRVKTLHPRIHAGLLARRGVEEHEAQLAQHGIPKIDIVVVNLYPFVETLASGADTAQVIEQIDIGGPSMLRSAAKNFESVTVLVDPADYERLACQLLDGQELSIEFRRELAAKVFKLSSAYDSAIARFLDNGGEGESFPKTLAVHATLRQVLRYGENPQQRAGFYVCANAGEGSLAQARLLGGKELSYNNILDLDAALSLICEFPPSEGAACCIIKHGNPCASALANSMALAFSAAREGDPVSAFGSIVACNREVDKDCAEQMTAPGNFLEALLAPSFSAAALEVLRGARFGKNLRLLELAAIAQPTDQLSIRSVCGGFLVQDLDHPELAAGKESRDCVTERKPTRQEIEDLDFAWLVAKHVRSNAIVLAKDRQTVGVGAGQMSRVDAVEIAVKKASSRSEASVLASDAFFPFADGPELAAKAGVTAIIQPGGSRRDKEVIEAANRAGLAMIFTGVRHFRH